MTPEAALDQLRHLFHHAGADNYFGEAVTKLDHSLQAAQLAVNAYADQETVLAALLHDIGHLLPEHSEHVDDRVGVIDHDEVGGRYLEGLGFSPRVVALVAAHVDAKRYLTSAHPDYLAKLSPASMETLRLQGGPMDDEERQAFGNDPLLADKLRIRSWDELAKEPGLTVPPFDAYGDMILAHLRSRA